MWRPPENIANPRLQIRGKALGFLFAETNRQNAKMLTATSPRA